MRAAWKLFDPDDKGVIEAADLYRVCNQLGYTVSERDVENMLSVLAPSDTGESVSTAKGERSRAISYDKCTRAGTREPRHGPRHGPRACAPPPGPAGTA